MSRLFSYLSFDLFSRENPQKRLTWTFPVSELTYTTPTLCFSSFEENRNCLHLQMPGEEKQASLDLDESDCHIDIQVVYTTPLGSRLFSSKQSFSIQKGTKAALCFHCGTPSTHTTS
ncbi:MAG TPA: hypothetical protein DHV41_01360, partial [Parachlamydiales bacterium]|nr:hypothetical protein [Parachlamydiales bacterium]